MRVRVVDAISITSVPTTHRLGRESLVEKCELNRDCRLTDRASADSSDDVPVLAFGECPESFRGHIAQGLNRPGDLLAAMAARPDWTRTLSLLLGPKF